MRETRLVTELAERVRTYRFVLNRESRHFLCKAMQFEIRGNAAPLVREIHIKILSFP